jgi:hypothetical protein
VDVFVSLKSQTGSSGVSINSNLVKARYSELMLIADELEFTGVLDPLEYK